MPYSKEHKAQSRDKILKSAMALFTRNGFANTSIDDVMKQAGMTRGAFYAHFKNKEDLYAEAIASASLFSIFARSKPGDREDKDWLEGLVSGYLSQSHVKKSGTPCPLAFLVTDIAIQQQEARQAYTEVFLKLNQLIQNYTKSYSNCSQETILAVTAMMIGGVAISRTLSDRKSQDQLLMNCRKTALALLNK